MLSLPCMPASGSRLLWCSSSIRASCQWTGMACAERVFRTCKRQSRPELYGSCWEQYRIPCLLRPSQAISAASLFCRTPCTYSAPLHTEGFWAMLQALYCESATSSDEVCGATQGLYRMPAVATAHWRDGLLPWCRLAMHGLSAPRPSAAAQTMATPLLRGWAPVCTAALLVTFTSHETLAHD